MLFFFRMEIPFFWFCWHFEKIWQRTVSKTVTIKFILLYYTWHNDLTTEDYWDMYIRIFFWSDRINNTVAAVDIWINVVIEQYWWLTSFVHWWRFASSPFHSHDNIFIIIYIILYYSIWLYCSIILMFHTHLYLAYTYNSVRFNYIPLKWRWILYASFSTFFIDFDGRLGLFYFPMNSLTNSVSLERVCRQCVVVQKSFGNLFCLIDMIILY